MAYRKQRMVRPRPSAGDRAELLRRRARRFAREGDFRKASLALRELVALTGAPSAYVALGDMLRRARRPHDALDALRQGLFLHRRLGAVRRARTVARMILILDPGDDRAARFAEAA